MRSSRMTLISTPINHNLKLDPGEGTWSSASTFRKISCRNYQAIHCDSSPKKMFVFSSNHEKLSRQNAIKLFVKPRKKNFLLRPTKNLDSICQITKPMNGWMWLAEEWKKFKLNFRVLREGIFPGMKKKEKNFSPVRTHDKWLILSLAIKIGNAFMPTSADFRKGARKKKRNKLWQYFWITVYSLVGMEILNFFCVDFQFGFGSCKWIDCDSLSH